MYNEKSPPAGLACRQTGRQAVVLLSGGLDSATTLYYARAQGFRCFCLSFDYGQRHKKEINSAKKIAQAAGCIWQVIKIALPWKGSSLLDKKLRIPELKATQRTQSNSKNSKQLKEPENPIPLTYVPGRNIIFLSFALSYAEAIKAEAICIGANAVDYSGYPDCRPEFYRAFIQAARLGTKAGVEGRPIKILTPLITKTKARIVKLGMRLAVPYELTWSCYKGGRLPCQKCDSCRFRAKGFREAGLSDPIMQL